MGIKSGIASNGHIYLSDRQNHRISVFTLNGEMIREWGSVGEGPEIPGGRFSEPHGITVGPDGHVFVCDRYNGRIQEFTPQGMFVSRWGAIGKTPGLYEFPCGLAAGADGSIYVTDHFNHRIDRYMTNRSGNTVEQNAVRSRPWAEHATDYGAPGVNSEP